MSIVLGLDASDVEKGVGKATNAMKAMEAEGLKVFNATRTPAEKLRAEMARLNALVRAGVISWDTYGRAVKQAKAAERSPSIIGGVFNRGAANVAAFVGSLLSIRAVLNRMGSGISRLRDLNAMSAELKAKDPYAKAVRDLEKMGIALSRLEINRLRGLDQEMTKFNASIDIAAAKILSDLSPAIVTVTENATKMWKELAGPDSGKAGKAAEGAAKGFANAQKSVSGEATKGISGLQIGIEHLRRGAGNLAREFAIITNNPGMVKAADDMIERAQRQLKTAKDLAKEGAKMRQEGATGKAGEDLGKQIDEARKKLENTPITIEIDTEWWGKMQDFANNFARQWAQMKGPAPLERGSAATASAINQVRRDEQQKERQIAVLRQIKTGIDALGRKKIEFGTPVKL